MFRVLYDTNTMSALVTMCFASPVGTCITRFIKRSHFQLLALYDSHTLSALQLCFRKPSRYMHHEIYQTRSRSVTCSLRFAYPVGTATMFSQAQSVHASRDLSYAVTFSYLLAIYDSHTLSAPAPKSFASPVGTCI